MLEIRQFESRLLSSNMYVISEGRHAIVIDPFEDTSPAEDIVIDYIILTHEHYDHISGVNIWKRKTGAPVLCSKSCAENICDSKKNLAKHFDVFCELQTWISLDTIPESDSDYSCYADETFENELIMSWEGHKLELFEIPGHSVGSIGILIDDAEFFSGDSLMENSKIELRLPGGSKKKWKEIGSIRLKSLPIKTRVWPGHFKSFTHINSE